MKIKIKKTVFGSPTGLETFRYVEGNVYDLPEHLTDVFIKIGAAEVYIPAPELIKHFERKGIEIAPENKMIESAPENKSSMTRRKK